MKLELSNHIRITGAPPYFCRALFEILTLLNPAYEEARKRGRWAGNIPKTLCFAAIDGSALIVPRGIFRQVERLAATHSVKIEIDDKRRTLPEVPFSFGGTLRDYQHDAVQDVLSQESGILNAPTGSGKTVLALAIIAARRQPTLVVVHTKELLQQWVDRACQFLGMSPDEIGQIGGGKRRIGDRLTVGIVNSIYPIASEIREHFGFVVVDECHRCPSRTFSEAVSAFDCRFMLGLSATPYRRDGLSRLINWYLGDQVHSIDKARLVQEGSILKPEILTRRTGFVSGYDLTEDYSKGISELTLDGKRNRQIASDVVEYLRKDSGPVLVLSDRTSHVETLADMITALGFKTAILTGTLADSRRKETIQAIRAGEVQAICATGSLVGEGFDLPALSALFMATPIKYAGRITQYAGRILRPSPGKIRPVIFDYCDANEVLRASARKRLELYKTNGWAITQ